MRTSTILTAAVLLTTLTACSGDPDPASNTAVSTPTASTPTATTPTPSPTPTPTPTPITPKPTPTAKPKPAGPRAADGYNYQSCRDAVCEIYVKTGSRVPVKRSVAGFSTLVVSRVAPTGVDFGGSTANTSVSAGGQQPGFDFRLNNLKVTTVAINNETAILHLRPA
ncbi:hypothetical protein EV643_102243 [Kribbella sp. VKM Ac-2527]|uniref:Uncharacterized protein n=1 Tax=Kribbella caucasensis TaxID=2512215 RepID=A0A4R6KLI6_9ACTN|nr:hypothetical protein [Kribbella sp. VKM Ac-2527]TDO52404.1 hypothetical protein EV643_102243 [Kribbella sp. VKM Ac-2527]